MEVSQTVQDTIPENAEVTTLAGGCFWCIESEFRSLEGVLYTRVGYEGGTTDNPTYRDITTGKTGHAEAVEIYFDNSKITYRELLDYFLTKAHDPTQKDRQGVDVGTQYRSAIFYHDEAQKQAAEAAITAATLSKVWKNPIVTEISPKSTFWEGEDYHQQYYEKYEAETGRPHIRVLLKKQK
ncbi:MAG: peptide-methionine (S)-S-oxide reductase MsrA [Alphaproteobacteria bacterium]|nr:peptide-methionine (S)-S-oxide reductase MsrA [Alphaproteobacteria bacterium]NCQ87451.1 peptide-methionine (S)-S-oxide reductase MsrA [Alphaproteobacteria bacterium]NCT06322.1 peptide-methionine (S)-S-oxide reductase MsrA [Alphaproteobacteria bacterium]